MIHTPPTTTNKPNIYPVRTLIATASALGMVLLPSCSPDMPAPEEMRDDATSQKIMKTGQKLSSLLLKSDSFDMEANFTTIYAAQKCLADPKRRSDSTSASVKYKSRIKYVPAGDTQYDFEKVAEVGVHAVNYAARRDFSIRLGANKLTDEGENYDSRKSTWGIVATYTQTGNGTDRSKTIRSYYYNVPKIPEDADREFYHWGREEDAIKLTAAQVDGLLEYTTDDFNKTLAGEQPCRLAPLALPE